jgi:hypothetical protein
MLVTFVRTETGTTLATIRRGDGVVVELPGYDRKHRVPHDLAHVVTERQLGLSGGVFGSIAGGGMFANMRVVAGRPRHDARTRSERLLDANKRTLGLAEVMAGVVHDAVEHHTEPVAAARARRTWASRCTGPFPWADEQVIDAVRRLAELSAVYRRDGTVSVDWPDRLANPVPPASGIKRGRRGRVH